MREPHAIGPDPTEDCFADAKIRPTFSQLELRLKSIAKEMGGAEEEEAFAPVFASDAEHLAKGMRDNLRAVPLYKLIKIDNPGLISKGKRLGTVGLWWGRV